VKELFGLPGDGVNGIFEALRKKQDKTQRAGSRERPQGQAASESSLQPLPVKELEQTTQEGLPSRQGANEA
jgi:hypothetical protein